MKPQLLILVGFSISLVGCGEDVSALHPHATPDDPSANSEPVNTTPDPRIQLCADLKQNFDDNPPFIAFTYTPERIPFAPSAPSVNVTIHNGVAEIMMPSFGFSPPIYQPVINQIYNMKFCEVDVDGTGLATFKEPTK